MSSGEASSPAGYARKRRRLNDPDGVGAKDSSSSEVMDSGDDSDDVKEDELQEEVEEKPVSKHRIHIVKDAAELPNDTFYTQPPDASQAPWMIRGPQWQRQSPLPKSAESQLRLSPVPNAHFRIDGVPQGLERSAKNLSSMNAEATRPESQRAEQSRPTPAVDFDESLLNEIDDLSSDAFEAAEESINRPPVIEISSQSEGSRQWPAQANARQASRAPQSDLRQTTLFGGQVARENSATHSTQSVRKRNWPLSNKDEPPTHHRLNDEGLKTWVYPTNLGAIRDYQYSIVARGLYHNLLVALPTGLGKTFIAATIMLNWFRWTEDAQMVFVAPTKPLVTQQVDACFHIAGIPRSATTLLTGATAPGIRAEEWSNKRVFFMTPQTLINDLKTGIADPKKIVLLVVDEAHRATGNYAYVEVVRFLRRFNTSFRVLALTATPGSSVEGVQDVIDSLGISRVEIRTEDSIDIRQYVHQRNIDCLTFDYSDEIHQIMDLLSKAIRPVLDILNGMNASWTKDPISLTAYGCMMQRQQWSRSDAGRNASFGTKGMVNSIFTILGGLAHNIELLKFHGIRPFFSKMIDFRDNEPEGNKGSRYRKQIINQADFRKMMSTVQTWVDNPEFTGHPKLEHLQNVVLNHFMDAGEGRGAAPEVPPSSTRIMVFAHYRDSAEEIVKVLKRNEPMIRPHVFVGQAASRGSEGMDQKKQLDMIQKFKSGVHNTLVATSIGEEGLDIGEVDLIVCYDASASPIRMLQRMGRTGRKRAGNIVVLLMKQKEKDNFDKAKDNYEKMQQMIAAGTNFQYHEDLSPRIVPKGVNPVVDRRQVEIPLENSQSETIEPKKKGRPPKRPPKKFHMPDGVKLGFTKASRLENDDNEEVKPPACRKRIRTPTPEPLPELSSVLLSATDQRDLERKYLDVGGEEPQLVEQPRLDKFPHQQRVPRPIKLVKHGAATERVIRMLNAMDKITDDTIEWYKTKLHPNDKARADACWSHIPVTNTASKAEANEDLLPSSMAELALPSSPLALLSPHNSVTAARRRKPEAPPSSTPAGLAAAGRRTRMEAPPSTTPPQSEGAGIDLINSDDEGILDEVDDDGSDLVDFIDDNTPREAPSSTSSPPHRNSDRVVKSLYTSAELVASQGQDDEEALPDMDTLLRESTRIALKRTISIDSEGPSSDVIRRKRPARRRVGVVNSGSEDD